MKLGSDFSLIARIIVAVLQAILSVFSDNNDDVPAKKG